MIAQGLHDSIAQALTFLNLQVQMLESAFASDQREQAEENIGFIKDGVQECLRRRPRTFDEFPHQNQ